MFRTRSIRRLLRSLAAAAALAAPAFAGCQSLATSTKLPWSKETVKESEFQTPVRMAVLWAEDVMTSPGQPPTRGFGARIYFYNERNQTISVEGQLVVYGYDDSKSDVSTRAPDRKFVYTAEQFKEHFSKSDLGASYSVWIPWDQAGGPQKEVSLIPVFTSSSGKVVVGPQGINVLTGPLGEKAKREQASRANRRTGPSLDIRTVSHWEAGAATGPEAAPAESPPVESGEAPAPRKTSSIRTSTIFVPNSMGRRMAADTALETAANGDETSAVAPRPIPGSAAASNMLNGGSVRPAPAPGFAPPQPPANVGSATPAPPIDPRLAALGNFAPAAPALPAPHLSMVGGENDPRVTGPAFQGVPAYSGIPGQPAGPGVPVMQAPGLPAPGMSAPSVPTPHMNAPSMRPPAVPGAPVPEAAY